MIISLIAAIDKNNGIGKDDQIPWHLPKDFKYFKETTLDHCIVMGRKTYESIGRPLPNRTNIIITRQERYNPKNANNDTKVVHSVDSALALAQELQEEECFIIGGSEIYSETISIAHRLYITKVHAESSANIYFPEIDANKWTLSSTTKNKSDKENNLDFDFLLYNRE